MRTRNMLRTPIAGLVGLCTALAVAAPATATHGGNHPTFREERVYFHCAGEIKLQNAGLVTDGASSWNTTAPASATTGEGCGAIDPGALRGANHENIYDAVFKGTFTGNLRNMTLEVHNLVLSRARIAATFRVRVRLSIDGEQVIADAAYVDVTPEVSSSGVSEKFLISFTGLGCTKEVQDANGNVVDVIAKGLATEDGNGEIEREVLLTIDSFYLDQASLWVWDAFEVPSGITFNAASNAPAKVAADSSVKC